MTTQSKITLNTIAKQAGLSITSVSRVLKTPDRVSATIRERVYQAINHLNAGKQYLLQTYKNVSPTKKILILDNQLIPQSSINQGIETLLKAKRYKLFYFRFLYCNQNDIYQIIHYTHHHAFDGILIINDAPYLKKLQQYQHALPPIVLINQFSIAFPCVYFDHLSIGYQTTHYFLQQGHKHIAMLLGDTHKMSTQHLVTGYQQALLRANLPINSHHLIYNCFHYQNGQQALKTLMTQGQPPTAIIVSDNICLNYMEDLNPTAQNYASPYSQVHGLLKQCKELDITIPKQLSVIYFNHDHQKQYNELDKLSAVNKPLQLMGESAVRLLLNLLTANKNAETANRQILKQQIETTMIFRHST
ncbi:LacI family DNA-binding transcriptional regulator [Orbaceae bacterium ESL0727]|nr:LacI family DNA-binding transcriptional regulator [Orbaceae bacterium ESL0727]